MSLEDAAGLIPLKMVRKYADANTPIVPLYENGDPDTRNIFTKEEMDILPLKAVYMTE